MIKTQRHLFDIADDIAYFNCAYNSPLLNDSVKRLHQGVDSKSHPWERTTADFFTDAETIRELSAELFGGDSDGFAIVPSASYGISTAARIIEPLLHKGDKILVIDEEFPSVVLPLKRVCQETGAILITVDKPSDGDWTNAITDTIDHKVKVVAISSCHWTNAAYIDLFKVKQACNAIGSILIVDATQSLGAMELDIDTLKPDFLVAAGYKWLLCPYGFTLFYVDEKWRNTRPLEETWIARENAMDFAGLANYSDTYMPGSRRFDMGERCTPTILPGAIAALEQITTWGVPNIADSLSQINSLIAKHLMELGFEMPVEQHQCPHMIGAKVPHFYKESIVSALKSEHIFISQRGNSLRFAPHLYINDNDIDRLLNVLDRLFK